MSSNTTKTHYLMFEPSTRWWYPLMKKGFGHVSIAYQLSDWQWIRFNYNSKGFTTNGPYSEHHVRQVGTLLRQEGGHCLEVRVKHENKTFGFGLLSCVGTVKRMLGIKAFWVLTPYQLYKHLHKIDKKRG